MSVRADEDLPTRTARSRTVAPVASRTMRVSPTRAGGTEVLVVKSWSSVAFCSLRVGQ